MIPFIELTTIPLGPVTIQVWGLLVALGMFAGAWAGAWLARRRKLDATVVWDAAAWIVAAALVGSRLFHVIVYDPATYLAAPWSVFAIWEGGLSMFGGLIGATAAALWFLRRRKLDLRAYADTIAFGLPVGIAIGRIGCFLIHDHPGTLTHFALGVRYPDGAVRHDLGLYESLYGIVMAVVFYILARRHAKPPTYLVAFLASYGAFRFAADFLRIVDARYAGLTPAQWLSLAMIVGAGFLVWKSRRAP